MRIYFPIALYASNQYGFMVNLVTNRSGAMDNIKAGVPRTAYKGVVSVWKDGCRVHLAPR